MFRHRPAGAEFRPLALKSPSFLHSIGGWPRLAPRFHASFRPEVARQPPWPESLQTRFTHRVHLLPNGGVGGIGQVILDVVGALKLGDQVAGEAGVEGGWLGVHRGIRDVIDDIAMNALFNQETKRRKPSDSATQQFILHQRIVPACKT